MLTLSRITLVRYMETKQWLGVDASIRLFRSFRTSTQEGKRGDI